MVRRAGIQYALEQCQDLLDNDVAGIHFYTLNRSAATRVFLTASPCRVTERTRFRVPSRTKTIPGALKMLASFFRPFNRSRGFSIRTQETVMEKFARSGGRAQDFEMLRVAARFTGSLQRWC